MTNKISDTTEFISKTISQLRQLTQVEVQSQWQCYQGDLELDNGNFSSIHAENWQPVTPNEKNYIVWAAGSQVYWLAQTITIPKRLQGYPLEGLSLRLVLTWWAELAQVFVDGKLVQEGDLFDSSARILLAQKAVPGETYRVAIRLISPGHDIGALMASRCVYESPDLEGVDPGWLADELTVLQQHLSAFAPKQLSCLSDTLNLIDWERVENQTLFNQSLQQLRQQLKPLAASLQQHRLNLLGHAHLDLAWLWTTAETYEVAERTFRSVLSLQQKYPHLTFGHTSPALYQWIQQHQPELFKQIKQAVAGGKWELLGGMWVEPDVNLISGESIVRQLLYGQRYLQQQFGKIATVAWLPDSFGFGWQLPQLMKQAGIEYFVTGKLHWNDTTQFPYGCFWWRSPDGTEILTSMSPPNLAGVMDTQPVTMNGYSIRWKQQTGLDRCLWLPGVGDHGGGPTEDMLAVAQRTNQSPLLPQLEFTRAETFLKQVSQQAKALPVWDDELYLELHRGCYTTHADQKYYNRRCEEALYQAELWSTLASILSGDRDKLLQDTIEIEKAWKQVLFNQFHDILPGTSIMEVFVEANLAWQEALDRAKNILTDSLKAIACSLTLPTPPHPEAKPIVVFNSLNWQRRDLVQLEIEGEWSVGDRHGNLIVTQSTAEGNLLFVADVPAIGYQLYWLLPQSELSNTTTKPDGWQLENQFLLVTIDSVTGDISSIWDKRKQKEVLAGSGNQLQAFTDQGQYWDAWNIDPDYEQYPLPPAQMQSIEWLEWGSLRQRLRVVKQIENSVFTQEYALESYSPILKINNTVDWQATHTVVKTAFPLQLQSDRVAAEIACGTIERPTVGKNKAEMAKWEASAHHWIDLTNAKQNYGVSILNDCKYGYDARVNQLRLTLLRGSQWPDPNADQGKHQFAYAIYPHTGGWQQAKTVQRGYEFNQPLQSVSLNSLPSNNSLPTHAKLLDLDADNLVLMAFKPGTNNHEYVLRCYESEGKTAKLNLTSSLLSFTQVNPKIQPVNLLENPIYSGDEVVIKPWQIVSLKLNFQRE